MEEDWNGEIELKMIDYVVEPIRTNLKIHWTKIPDFEDVRFDFETYFGAMQVDSHFVKKIGWR